MPQAAVKTAEATPGAIPSAARAPEPNWKQVENLPCKISVEVPVHGFTLKHLLALAVGSVVSSRHLATSDLPLRLNGELIAWGEFEVLGERLSVQFTEIA